MPDALSIGRMDHVCGFCGALRWKDEPAGSCCSKGKVSLPFHPPPPPELMELFQPHSPLHREFMKNIRMYNCAFQLASMGCNEVRPEGWVPNFAVQGNICHFIGSLIPADGAQHKFLQIYFLDDQVAARAGLFDGLNADVLRLLDEVLHRCNAYVQALRPAKLMLDALPDQRCQIVLTEKRRPLSEHERRFNLPSCREVAVLMPNEPAGRRDIIIQHRDGPVRRIDEFHRSYDPLHYVLLYPFGTDGWSLAMKLELKITVRQFYAFYQRYRPGHFNIVPRGRRLFQQLLVDAQVRAEADRLNYVRANQDGLRGHRSETVRGVRDALEAGEQAGRAVGRVILPASFTGGPRYMMAKLQDCLTYVREFGGADFFVTVTCDPKWPEISDTLQYQFPGDAAHDHPDIVSEVFHLKLKGLLQLLRGGVLGHVRAIMHTVEWQKRGESTL